MPTTSNFGWTTPADTDLVKDGAAAIRTLGNGVDSSFVDLKGGTSGQILSKNSNTDLDFVWIANDQGDITAVTAGTGISGGGTSGAVTITNSMATEITASGDIIVGTGSGTFDNLPIGSTGQVLTADTTVSPYKVKWATPAAGFGTLTAYTPTLVGITIGNGTFSDVGYSESGDAVWYYGMFSYGSTSTSSGAGVQISLPVNADPTASGIAGRSPAWNFAGVADTSTGYYYPLMAAAENTTPSTRLDLYRLRTDAANLFNDAVPMSGTVNPIALGTGDTIWWNFIYKKA